MNISKSLFKELTRCKNFGGLYDLYMNRSFHEVQEIDFKDQKILLNNQYQDVIDDINKLDDNLFEDDPVKEIFNTMFDEDTGEDLLVTNNLMLETYQDIFKKVELLAIKYAEKIFNIKIKANSDTYSQKKIAYNYGGHTFYCYLDGYYEDASCIKIFEVKATTSNKFDKTEIFETNDQNIAIINPNKLKNKEKKVLNRFDDVGKYFYDASIECCMLEESLKLKKINKKIDCYLIVLNSEYYFDGKYDEQGNPLYDDKLFKIYNINEIVNLYEDIITKERNDLIERINYLKISFNETGSFCEYGKKTMCKFAPVCLKKALIKGSIFEYLDKRYAFKINGESCNVYDLINLGKYSISETHDYISKINNLVQYDCVVNNKPYYDYDNLKLGISKIKYPIYYLDFESYNSPLPRFVGEKPFTQSVFQYSLHVEKEPGKCDIEKDHLEFLAKDHLDRREELIKQLIHDIDLSDGGTVIVYNETFEKSRLKELAEVFPQYKDALYNIHDHIYDLYYLIKGNKNLFKKDNSQPSFNYYHKNLYGSFSIKHVLPLFSPLNYHDLEVKNGNEASLTYGMLPMLIKEEYQNKYLALKIYCRQDTWAMVEILHNLKNKLGL